MSIFPPPRLASVFYDLLDEEDLRQIRRMPQNSAVTQGRIEFCNVVFAYRAGETVLHGISFVAEAGKTTALVGRSGGGKSTVMNLILRLYKVGAGQILCDGQDIATVGLSSLRRQIGYMSQENFLFKGSMRDNIAMGRPSERGRDRRRRQGGLCARLHHGLRARLRLVVRRAWHAAVRRAASTHRHSPRVSEGRADHPFRRSDFGARF